MLQLGLLLVLLAGVPRSGGLLGPEQHRLHYGCLQHATKNRSRFDMLW